MMEEPKNVDVSEKESNHAGGTVSKGNATKYFTFDVGSETYGTPVSRVKEIIEYGKVFKIPRTNNYIMGVTNLRGEVIPIVDLAFRFYEQSSETTIHTSVVIVEHEHNGSMILLGILIDQMKAVADIYDEDIDAIPDFSAKIPPEFIKEIGKVNNEFIILLDMENVLKIEDLSTTY